MARTLIGELILRLQTQGLGNARKVISTLHDVENAAKRLGRSGIASWGSSFQRNLDKLKLSPQEFRDIQASWIRLQRAMSQQKFAPSAKQSGMAQWKQMTLQHFAAVRAGYDNHTRIMETKTRTHRERLRNILRTGFVAGGFYTLTYGGGLAIRGGLRAASEATRTKYRMRLANIPADEQEKMQAEADRLSAKYGPIDAQDILELNKTAYALFGGNGDRARKLVEPMVKAFIADVTAVGVDKAGENLSSFLKAMDNLNVNEGPDGGIANIDAILEGWIKAKQVEGKDIDVGDILGFARRAKVAKYALSDHFLTNLLPALGQDMGFSALGDALSGAYQNFVTPSSGGRQGQYVKRQQAIGLRDANNSLIERDLFASNPYRWTLDVLKPLLEKQGVDTANTAAVSEAVKKLMSNSKAAAAITGWIEAQQQIDKNVALYQMAAGTSDAENARSRDPFAASESLLAALRNLSAATLPMNQIAVGLNTVADGVNALAAAAKDNPFMTAFGMGAAGYGAFKGGKWVGGKLADAFGLKSSALALDGSAAALTRAAAVLQGAAGGNDVVAGAGKSGGSGKTSGRSLLLPLLGRLAGTVGVAYFLQELLLPDSVKARRKKLSDQREAIKQQRIAAATDARLYRKYVERTGPPRRYSRGSRQGYRSAGEIEAAARDKQFDPAKSINVLAGAEQKLGTRQTVTTKPDIDTNGIQADAATSGQQVKDALSVTARPNVDTSSLHEALQLARATLATLRQIPGAISAVDRNFSAEMRRNFSD